MTDVIIPEYPSERRRLARSLLRDPGGYVSADALKAWARADLAKGGPDPDDAENPHDSAALRGVTGKRRR